MIAKGRPSIDIEETGEEQLSTYNLFRYAEDIKKRLKLVDGEQGTKREWVRYNCWNSMLSRIMAECGECVQIIKKLTPKEYDNFCDDYSAECDCRLQCNREDLSKLDVFVDMILEESKRVSENEEYESWFQKKINGHYWSTFLLFILVNKLEREMKDACALLESANYNPNKSKKERVGNVVNMYGGSSYTDVHGNTNVTLNITTGAAPIEESASFADSGDSQRGEISRAISHFGLDAEQRAHWADVYSRLVTAGMIKRNEVTSTNFTWLMCGDGTAPFAPIRWYGSTRELAYMVRNYLNSKWDVAMTFFRNNKNSELPKTFNSSSQPSPKSADKIDQIFRTRD